jgi:hypothetical protein
MRFLLFCIVPCLFAAHTDEGVKERNITVSDLFISIPDGMVRLVFWHSEGFDSEREARKYILQFKQIREATKTENQMFFELYDSKTIKRYASVHSRRMYTYDRGMIEVLPKWFTVVVIQKPP